MVILGKIGQDGFAFMELIGNIEENMVSYMKPQKPLDVLSYMHWLGYEEDKGIGARL